MTIVTDDKLGGEARVEGTRIGVYHIVQYHRGGETVEEIAAEFELEESTVERALEYAENHPDEIEAVLSIPDDRD